MNKAFNPVSTSGIGFKLEHYVQASYLAALLLETPVPFGNGLLVSEINFQAKLVANADDIIVHFSTPTKYFVQSKKGLEINANEVFIELFEFLWKDFNNQCFDQQNHKFIITTDVLSKADAENGLLVLEWARFSKNSVEFLNKIKANKEKQAKYKYFLDAIEKANGGKVELDVVWFFLKTIYIQTYDYLATGSKDKEVLKWYLQPFLKPGNTSENVLLELLSYIWECNQHGASLSKSNIESKIKDLFDLQKSPQIGTELTEFIKKSCSQLEHNIENNLDGLHIDRTDYLMRISESMSEKKIIIISGEGGVGKSGLVKEYLEECLKSNGSYLLFKADQLDRSSLAHTLSDLGVTSDFETILSQWRLLPRLIIYIDSFEKLYESEHKESLLELMGKLKQTNNNITLIATCRTFAIETLRIKYRFSKDEIGIIEVLPLSNDQLLTIADAKPKLQKIIANPKLSWLVSLPFYLNIASQVIDSIANEDQLSEAEFKKELWEFIIEKKGAGKTGIGKKRADIFSQIALKRAKEKLPFIKPEVSADTEVLSQLKNEGLLIKHPKMDAYAPAHDIFEDMAIVNHLNELFFAKTNNLQFFESVDSNPVFRRAIRLWIQELILQQPQGAKSFLSDILPLYKENGSLIDEIMIGILASHQAYILLKQNEEIFVKDNLKLFYKAFRLLKIAYTEPYNGEHPERKIKTSGNGWTALLKILDENFEVLPMGFTAILPDLLAHWNFQYEIGDPVPEEGKIVAKYCWKLLETDKDSFRFDSKRRLLEILFSVSPQATDTVEKLIKDAVIAKKENDTALPFTTHFYRDLFKMLLVETFRCVNIYKLFPEMIIELAEMEWYNIKPVTGEFDTDYMESSFGLNEYPYKYFSSSSYQTPFRYLFRYHPELALSFLIRLCNRGIDFYIKSTYAQQSDAKKITMTLSGNESVELYADVNLWVAYRGIGNSPYLLQSALMAFEQHLFEGAASDSIPENLFERVLHESNSILLVGVISSIAMAYPLIFSEKIYSILKIREFFSYDLNRYSQDFASDLHTTIGNDPYYTQERRLSNNLKHRNSNLEHLVSKLQFYYPSAICEIIDSHKKNADPNDHLWQLAILRMDMRNTTPEIKEEEEVIIFNPNPLPVKLQEFIDDGNDEREEDSSAITVFLWAEKSFGNESDTVVSYLPWKGYYETHIVLSSTKTLGSFDASKKLAAIALKYFPEQLTEEEAIFCISTISKNTEKVLRQLKLGYSYSALDVINDNTFSALPYLLAPPLTKFVNADKCKQDIFDLVCLLPPDTKKHLVTGIRVSAWQIDEAFSHQCFQLLLKQAKYSHLHHQMQRFRDLPPEEMIGEVNSLLNDINTQPEVDPASIDFLNDNHTDISMALNMIPYLQFNKGYREYIVQMVNKAADLGNIEDRDNEELIENIYVLLGNYFRFNSDTYSANTLIGILALRNKNFRFVMGVLKWFVWIGHDAFYPDQFWFHINVLTQYVFNESPTYGFIQALLLEPLKNVSRCNKISENGSGRKIHEAIISEFAGDKNLIEAVFKLLSGVGSVYQPDCFMWLMKSLPDRKAYDDHLGVLIETSYITEFVNQIYTHHITHIRANKDQMDYFIMLLNLLIDYGSTLAFRIRDELI